MSELKANDPEFSPNEPLREEEETPEDRSPIMPHKKNTASLNPKDSRAFWLTVICLSCLASLYIISLISRKPIDVNTTFEASLVDILKYVITTSLGFFFATTMTKKD